jgi:hypothetical protein
MKEHYSISKFEISYEGIENEWNKEISVKLEEELSKLYQEISKNPSVSIMKLEKLKFQHPHIPKIDNLLSIAYSMNGNEEKSELVIMESFEKFPNYLFSRINYAELCLKKGEFEKIPKILEHKFDLKLLYPKRNIFHVSEVNGFYGIVGKYSFYLGNEDTLKVCYDLLKKLNNNHQNTIILENFLALIQINTLFSSYRKSHGLKGKNKVTNKKNHPTRR